MEVFPIKAELMINDKIRAKEVRVVSAEGEQLGIMSTKAAQELADDQELDLILMVPNAVPPVCKIMDYGKYRFEQSRYERESRKNQKVINIKGIRLSPTIEAHDIEVKTKMAQRFLEEGDKVKISVKFRGRQLAYTEAGTKLLDSFAAGLQEVGTPEKRPMMEGRNMILFIAPKVSK